MTFIRPHLSSAKLEQGYRTATELIAKSHFHALLLLSRGYEHRIGLKPITRGVWAPIGERPVAVGHHRFEWLYVTM